MLENLDGDCHSTAVHVNYCSQGVGPSVYSRIMFAHLINVLLLGQSAEHNWTLQSSMMREVSNLLRQLRAMARHIAKGITSSLLDSRVKLLKAGHQTL